MKKRIILFDSLRGIAALIVVFHHIFVINQAAFVTALTSNSTLFRVCTFVSDQNRLAVLFFFVLSGFVIYLATHKLDFRQKSDLNHYLYRRFRRILPLYWFTLIFSLTIGLAGGYALATSFEPLNLLGNLLFLQTSEKIKPYWFVPYAENGPLWSLAYEMFFYVFFPLFWLLLERLTRRFRFDLPVKALAGALFLAILAIAARQFFFTPFFSFLALFPIWIAGYYLGYLYVTDQYADRLLAGISLLLLGGWLANALLLSSATLKDLLEAWFVIIIPGYIYYRWHKLQAWTAGLRRWVNRLFRTIGEGSFAIYLLHYPIIRLMAELADWSLRWEITVIFMWCASCIFIEKWIDKWPYRFFRLRYV